jgi:hypothetical protein
VIGYAAMTSAFAIRTASATANEPSKPTIFPFVIFSKKPFFKKKKALPKKYWTLYKYKFRIF